jgi:hypothetical protein
MFSISNKFYAAVRALAGSDPLKKRLISAYSENLEPLPKVDVPESIRPQFGSLWRAMHSAKPVSTESRVIASVRKMSTAEADSCASIIVTMFSELVSDKATGEPLRLSSRADTELMVEIAQRRASTLN